MATPMRAAGSTDTYAAPAGDCGGNSPCFTSINSAIANTSDGGTVHVLGGTFSESVTLVTNVVVAIESDTTVNDFTISNGTLSFPSGNTLTLAVGNWSNNGGTFTPGTGTVAFAGSSAQTIGGSVATTFGNVTINKTNSVTLGQSITISGNLAVTAGTLSLNGQTLTIGGNTTITGTLDASAGSAKINVAGNWTINGHFNIGSSTTTFNGSAPQLINDASGSAGFANFVVASSSTVSTGASTLEIGMAGPLKISSGTFNAPATLDLNNTTSAATLSGGTLVSSGVINVVASTADFTGGTALTLGSATLNLSGTGAQSFKVPNGTTVGSLVFNHTSSSDAITVSGTPLTINQDLTVTAATVTLPNSTTVKGNLLLTAGGLSPGSTLVLGGNLTVNGGTFSSSSTSVTFNGAAAQTIGGTTARTFGSMTVNNASGVTLGVNQTVGGTLTLTNGILAVGTNTLTLNGGVSFTSGSITSSATGLVTYNQASNGQGVAPGSYGNLTFSNFNKTLPNGGTVGIAGTFTPGTATGHTVTGSTVIYNGSTAQTLPSSFTSYNNLTLNNAAGTTGFDGLTVQGLFELKAGTFTLSTGTATLNNVQFDSGTRLSGSATYDVAGNWTCNSSLVFIGLNLTFNGSSPQLISGTASTLSINGALTINSTSTVSIGGSMTSITIGSLIMASGTFNAPQNLNINGGVSTASGTTFVAGASLNLQGAAATYDFSNGTFTAGSGTIIIDGTGVQPFKFANGTTLNNFTVNTPGITTLTGTPVTINGALTVTSGTFTVGVGNTLHLPGSTKLVGTINATGANITVEGDWGGPTSTGIFQPGTGTLTFDGAGAQSLYISGTEPFNNFVVNKSGGTLTGAGASSLTVNSGVTLTSGTFAAGTLTNISLSGNWTNNSGASAFTPGSGTVAFIGSATQSIGGTSATTFNNLTNSNTAGLTLSLSTTVNGVLALTSSDLSTGANTLIQPSTAGASTGSFDVVGNYQRTGANLPNTALTYGNPNNIITLAGSSLTSLTVQLTKGSAPASLPKAVQRSYGITPAGGSFTSASVQLHYLNSELNGNTEFLTVLTRFDSGQNRWLSQGASSRDITNKWVQATGVTQFPATWTLISPPTIASITPNQGKTAGGDSVTIAGTYLTSASGVTFGGAALTNVSFVSDTQITGTTPPGAIGAASVIATAAGGSNAANTLFTYIGPPVASNGGPINTGFNTAVGVTLSASDPNTPAEALTYACSQPAHGVVTGSGTSLTYTPASGYHGADSFTFTATNTFGLTSNTATESLVVAAGTPTASPQSVNVTHNTATPITLAATDPDTTPPVTFTYAIATNPTHGALSSLNASTGAVTYTPTAGYHGSDTFTFTANNGANTSTAATVTLTVTTGTTVGNAQNTITVSAGTATIVFAGIPGDPYQPQYSDTLDANSWINAGQVIDADSNGQIIYTDTDLPLPSRRFYRAIPSP